MWAGQVAPPLARGEHIDAARTSRDVGDIASVGRVVTSVRCGAQADMPAGQRPSQSVPDHRRLGEAARRPSVGIHQRRRHRADGSGIWVAERCGANACAGSPLPSVYLFDATGAVAKSFGAGLILSPHGIDVDREGNVWVTDCACTLGRNAAAAESARRASGLQVQPRRQVAHDARQGRRRRARPTRGSSGSRTTCSSRLTARSTWPRGTRRPQGRSRGSGSSRRTAS